MRNQIISTTFLSATAILLLCIALLAPAKANAAAALISPSTQLTGIPEAGAPSFAFNASVNRFGGDVRSWYDNYLVVQNVGGATGSYNFFAHNEGSFTYWETMDTSYAGSSGIFDLSAEFDSSGNLIAGTGTVQITGAIEGIGITDASSVLMTANLVDFVFKDDLIGFSINNIICDPEGGPNGGRIEGCASSATQVESIYFGLAADFPGIAELGGMNYRSTITSATTVPIPATVWLMLSGLSLIGSMALRRKSSTA
jgi:hypothetical protein